MNKLLLGAVAGFAATVPMTLAMKLLHQELPAQEQYPLPPRLIIESLADKAEVEDDLGETAKTNLSIASHFAYGTSTGALYGAIVSEPNAANGAAYGLAVWAGSYLGWLPAAGILTPATQHPANRNAVNIVSHIIWGATLGEIMRQTQKGEN